MIVIRLAHSPCPTLVQQWPKHCVHTGNKIPAAKTPSRVRECNRIQNQGCRRSALPVCEHKALLTLRGPHEENGVLVNLSALFHGTPQSTFRVVWCFVELKLSASRCGNSDLADVLICKLDPGSHLLNHESGALCDFPIVATAAPVPFGIWFSAHALDRRDVATPQTLNPQA